MNKFFALLLVSLATLCSGHELEVANVSLITMPQEQQQGQQHQQEIDLRQIQVIQDIKEYIKQHPQLSLLRLNKKTPANRLQSVKYMLGNRVSGDRMVAQYANTYFYPAKKDVSIQETYPQKGTGSIITSIDINCLQDNHDGNAYVVAGGVGQRFISVVMEAPQTERFTYNIHIYGKN